MSVPFQSMVTPYFTHFIVGSYDNIHPFTCRHLQPAHAARPIAPNHHRHIDHAAKAGILADNRRIPLTPTRSYQPRGRRMRNPHGTGFGFRRRPRWSTARYPPAPASGSAGNIARALVLAERACSTVDGFFFLKCDDSRFCCRLRWREIGVVFLPCFRQCDCVLFENARICCQTQETNHVKGPFPIFAKNPFTFANQRRRR